VVHFRELKPYKARPDFLDNKPRIHPIMQAAQKKAAQQIQRQRRKRRGRANRDKGKSLVSSESPDHRVTGVPIITPPADTTSDDDSDIESARSVVSDVIPVTGQSKHRIIYTDTETDLEDIALPPRLRRSPRRYGIDDQYD
jgi:hypothetical protein